MVVFEDSFLDRFYKSTASMDPMERALYLENDREMEVAHSDAVAAGETEASDNVNDHFICYACVNGQLYKLDGRKTAPVSHGPSSPTSLLQEIAQQQLLSSHVDSLVIPSGQSTFKEVASGANNMISKKDVSTNRLLKKNRVVNVVEDQEGLKMAILIIDGSMKQKDTNNFFYDTPFVFKETEKNVRDLVTSPFTKRIRDYDMTDGLKVPTKLKTYDGLSNPDDHLTIFMGTMDVHKLPEPAWCRFFQITLSGAARFWYDNLPPGGIDSFHELRNNFVQQRRFKKTQAEILGIRQRSDESLKDYLARFGEETLHMTDGMMT
ncbi:reverse transcriptase domain-containing protein [Tanacetum coccineum]